MGKRYKNLFPQIVTDANIWRSYHQAAKGKHYSFGHLLFREHLAANLGRLRDSISAGSYRPGQPHKFMIYEPKPRLITAMPFVDRVAEHALCNVIEPIFDGVFLPQSYACRRGKGTHAAACDVQAMLRHMPADGAWILKTDFSKYFASIRRDVLHHEYQRKISCHPTLSLLETMIPTSGQGLDIGRLTSQLSANVIGHVVDRWLVHHLGITRFARYMDDIVVLSQAREAMSLLRLKIEWFARTTLGLSFSHWSLIPATRGVNFVGYRIWDTHKLLRRDSVARAKRKVRSLRARHEDEKLRRFLDAWTGHACHADTYNLMNRMGIAA
ncbi:reverse transcriptase domain-containing protein [Castellaniella sp.]|uniref:reverse transcriptase domain-containing protein n=1 Tax=Castellaniella sp. TaxID=1955812 RepID=UPI003216286D